MKDVVRTTLKALIQRHIVVNINGITLSSGKTSTFYYDLRKVALNPLGADHITDLIEIPPNTKFRWWPRNGCDSNNHGNCYEKRLEWLCRSW
ncbi:MAG: hypothetical protein WA667_08930 [Candidatus Nitrosopolaris sp.]